MELSTANPTTSASYIGSFVTILYEPGATFRKLNESPKAWLPLVLLLASTLVITVWYFSIVDFTWLLDQLLSTLKTASEREQAGRLMTKKFMMISTIASGMLLFPILLIVLGSYLMIASKIFSQGMSFGKGFNLAVWSSVPSILLLPLGAIQIIMSSSGQLSFSDLNPMSLNQLLFHYDIVHPLSAVMDSLCLTTLWSAVLLVIGFKIWANVKPSTATMVITIPYFVFYGAWLMIGLSKLG